MKRALFLAYGVVCYLAFLATFGYAIGFVTGMGTPTALDGPATTSLPRALAIDAGLLALFAVQHSVMARRGFKEWWTKIVPEPIERSTYVLFASAALALLLWQWRPLGGTVWEVEGAAGTALLALSLVGWAVVVVATFLTSHTHLFGLTQVWHHFRGRPRAGVDFKVRGLYRWARHPLYLGFLVAFWATPRMTMGHLFFAVGTTAYILVAIQLEERDLVHAFGEKYRRYRERVPMLVPLGGGEAPEGDDASSRSTAVTGKWSEG